MKSGTMFFEVSREYNVPVYEYRPSYEFIPGEAMNNAPRSVENKRFGVMTDRQFSNGLQFSGWNIANIALLNHTRFAINGEEIVGRDILVYKHNLSSDIVLDFITLANKQNDKIIVRYAGIVIEIWQVASGKRTRYGLPSNGGIIVKNTAPKVYRRNRKSSQF